MGGSLAGGSLVGRSLVGRSLAGHSLAGRSLAECSLAGRSMVRGSSVEGLHVFVWGRFKDVSGRTGSFVAGKIVIWSTQNWAFKRSFKHNSIIVGRFLCVRDV